MKIVELAKKEGALAISHGCTGKGNDQFRFESTIRSSSSCQIIAPVRDLNLTRSEEIEYAKSHCIPLPIFELYSIDENIWGKIYRRRYIRGSYGGNARRSIQLDSIQ